MKTPAGLPPFMALAVSYLQAALAAPATVPAWPVVNTPRLQAQLDAAKARAGRPTSVQPNQVVRLVRLVKLGHPLRKAAEKAGLARSTAQRVMAGQHPLSHHPAVELAGVSLPGRVPPGGPKPAQKAGKAPGSAEQARAATPVAKTASGAQNRGGL